MPMPQALESHKHDTRHLQEITEGAGDEWFLPRIRFFNHYFHSAYLILGSVEFLLLFTSVYAATYVDGRWVSALPVDYDALWVPALYFAVVLSLCTMSLGIYSAYLTEGFNGLVLRTVAAFCLLGSAALLISYFLFPLLWLSSNVFLLAVIGSVALVSVVRFLGSLLIDLSKLGPRVVIYGSGARAAEICATCADGASGVQILGCVNGGGDDNMVPEKLLVSAPEDWYQLAKKNHIDEIVIAPDERRRRDGATFPVPEFLECKLRGIRVTDSLDFVEREQGRLEIDQLHPGWMLFSKGFYFSRVRDYSKRVFDLAISLFLLVLFSPFMLLTAVAVKLESPGEIIFSQRRVGLGGKVFNIYKFRSMCVDAEGDGKAVWATKNDPRVTRVGSFIRNTRLDELPQLWNVIKGDMSFVGPRPERPEFVEELAKEIPFYNIRHHVKPGMMGWAQLKYPYGASVQDAKNKLSYDLYYTKNHSFMMDILIVIQTVEIVLLGKGVH